jgi:hypothetical protein
MVITLSLTTSMHKQRRSAVFSYSDILRKSYLKIMKNVLLASHEMINSPI